MGARTNVWLAAAREFLTYDLGILKEPVARASLLAAKGLLSSPAERQRAKAFKLLLRLHSAAFSASVDRTIADLIRDAMASERNGTRTGLSLLFDQLIANSIDTLRKSAKPDPMNMIGSHVLVVKAARPNEKGVIVVDYSNHFPLFAGLFDLDEIARRYSIVLEPSWAGASSPDILLYSQVPGRVFVETIEPRDREFIHSLQTNLRPVPVAANWWVTPRDAPAVERERDIDVAMIAAWADIKRHWRVFRALGQLKRQGRPLKMVLVGYRYDHTMAEIADLAAHYGIRDQVELREYIPQDDVWDLLQRSKIHVLWSRRECANRAIIEAMLANVPVIVRKGLTFGFEYLYINTQTGRFVQESDLADAIVSMIDTRTSFSPRPWVLNHMTFAKANEILEQHVSQAAGAAGEPWTAGLAPKTSTLYGQQYVNEGDRQRFKADYDYLASQLRTPQGAGSWPK